jgi:hypothetical protein
MSRLTLTFCAALALFGANAHAENRFCAGAGFSDTPVLMIGKVKSTETRVKFARNGDEKNPSCPSAAAECQDRAFLVPGDLVVMGGKLGEFICADYNSAKGDRGGWLPAAALEPANVSTNPADWSGDWTRVEAEIKIKNSGGSLRAEGNATFGALDPSRVKRGAVNLGDFSGPLVLQGGQATFSDKDIDPKKPDDFGCRLRMARAGDLLFVQDNMQCGGMNVSFSGLYRRAGK